MLVGNKHIKHIFDFLANISIKSLFFTAYKVLEMCLYYNNWLKSLAHRLSVHNALGCCEIKSNRFKCRGWCTLSLCQTESSCRLQLKAGLTDLLKSCQCCEIACFASETNCSVNITSDYAVVCMCGIVTILLIWIQFRFLCIAHLGEIVQYPETFIDFLFLKSSLFVETCTEFHQKWLFRVL